MQDRVELFSCFLSAHLQAVYSCVPTYSSRYTHSSSASVFPKASSRFFLTAVARPFNASNPGVLKNIEEND